MTDLASALADKTDLGEYRGRDIIRTSVKITKAGDGLSKSMGIAPAVYEQGDELMVLLKVVVGPHTHKMIADTECLELIQSFEAETAVIVDDAASRKKLDRQENALRVASERARGVERIPGTEDAIDGKPDPEGLDPE